VGTALRAHHRLPAGDGDLQGDQAVLRNEGWRCDDTVWWRPQRETSYRALTTEDADALDKAVAAR